MAWTPVRLRRPETLRWRIVAAQPSRKEKLPSVCRKFVQFAAQAACYGFVRGDRDGTAERNRVRMIAATSMKILRRGDMTM
jgi:hypothetical protein